MSLYNAQVRITFDPYEIEKEGGGYEIRESNGKFKDIENNVIIFQTNDDILDTLDKIKEIASNNPGVEKIEYYI